MIFSLADRRRLTIALLASCSAGLACAGQSANRGGPENPGDWKYSKTITLDTTPTGANVTEDVENYPLAVLLDRSRFDFDQAQPSGADLRFFDPAGKPLPHAIELWDKPAGKAAIWVLLERVKAGSQDQSIVMRWGHPRAPDASNSQAVFKMEHG